MSNDEAGAAAAPSAGPKRVYDSAERTARFGEAAIDFPKRVPLTPLTGNIVDQLVRSATSVGANSCEADDAGSPAEFRHRINIRRRESRETMFWLRMSARAAPDRRDASRVLDREADELNRIFAAVHRKLPAPTRKPR